MRFESRSPEAAAMVQAAVARCTYPFDKVAEHVVMPVDVSDLSRYLRPSAVKLRGATGDVHESPHGEDPEELPGFGHADIHTEGGEEGHGIIIRQAVYGLYWLPTPQYPAGRIEVERTLAGTLQQEVFLAEAWHGLDYTVLTAEQRDRLLRAYHGMRHPHEVGHVSDWFEEGGEQSYPRWCGESGMVDFVRLFSDIPPSFDFFFHKLDGRGQMEFVDVLRGTVPPPLAPPEEFYGFPRRRVFHKAGCWVLRLPSRAVPLSQAEIASRRPCRFCKPSPSGTML